jgi:uncharacterized phage protein (predicted DNA packaging)
VALKDVLTIDTQEVVKPFMRIDYAEDDALIDIMKNAAIQRIDDYLCRDFAADANELHAIRLIALQVTAHYYENRGDANDLPDFAKDALGIYRFEPGF